MSRMGQEFIRMQEAGEIPQGTSVLDMIPVRCNRCGWEGYTPQLKAVYVAHPNCPGDVVTEPGCPACLSDQFLEYKEEVTSYATMNMLRSLAFTRDVKQTELEQAVGYRKNIPF